MRIVCVGGGPAGLYFAISAKLQAPAVEVVVLERNQPDDTFGWGVVLSDQTLDNLRANDPQSAAAIEQSFAYWDDIEVVRDGRTVRSGGHGFCGISRHRLLNLLQARAAELGAELRYGVEVDDVDALLADHDLVIASDGLNSRIRTQRAEVFVPQVDVRTNRFVWLGSDLQLDAFSFVFEMTEHGPIWIHAYQFEPSTSTVIVECSEHTWRGLGFDRMEGAESIARCEELFAGFLKGHRLRSNAAHLRGSAIWLQFPRVACERWFDGRLVLLGDSAHTAHFSIGSGTKLAIEDAVELAARVTSGEPLAEALEGYEEVRRLEVLKLQSAARNSMEWFEHVERYLQLDDEQFAYALLTRSQRVSHENLRVRDSGYVERVETHLSELAGRNGQARAVPPMFTPFRVRGATLRNRVVVSPMSMYSAVEGVPDDFHLVHYGSRAMGGAGLLMTEMTDVTRDGRITPGCAGIWNDEQAAAWKRIVEYVHRTPTLFGLQLGHAGPKASTKLEWLGANEPLGEGNWPIMAASDVPWSSANQVPKPMSRADMDAVTAAYVAAAERGAWCGFDWLELHMAHGYLLSSFITPVSNTRTDEYGGPLENRLRYPLEVFHAVRAAWPAEKPISVRISATDWVGEDGILGDDSVEIAKAFSAAGADLIDVSAGQTTTLARPVYGRMFQTPLADQIRNEAGIATMAVGNITEPDHVNSIIAAGRADLCCLGRPHLSDPNWTLRAAAQLGYEGLEWPDQYLSGGEQMRRLARRAAEAAIVI